MKESPLVSVIIPVYGAEKTLEKCVDSILEQSFCDYELILVDDGSKDNSGNIIDEYASRDSRIVAIHKQNGGVSSARNAGLDIAKGEWILFCDSDDYVMKNWIETFLKALECDMLIQSLYYERDGNIWRKDITAKNWNGNEGIQEVITMLIDKGMYGYPVTKSFRKSIIDKYNIRFDENCHFREDEIFVSRYLTHASNVETVNYANYVYRLPDERKYYKGSLYYAPTKVFKELDIIFGKEFNSTLSKIHLPIIKDMIITKIINGDRVDDYDVDLYRRLLQPLSRKSLIDKLILKTNRSNFYCFLLSIVHKILIHK